MPSPGWFQSESRTRPPSPSSLPKECCVERPVFPGRPEQEADLLGVEQRLHQQKAIVLIAGKLLGGEGTGTHGKYPRLLNPDVRPAITTRVAPGQPEQDLPGISIVQLGEDVVGQEDAVDHPEALAMMAAGRVEILVVGFEEAKVHPVGSRGSAWCRCRRGRDPDT